MRVASIFHSLDGEVSSGSGAGQWASFIRLQGCHLRCYRSTGYCDAPHTLLASTKMTRVLTVKEICGEIQAHASNRVTITGGEPLIQRFGVFDLAERIHRDIGDDIEITMETSGCISFANDEISPHINCVVMDLKLPSSEMSHHNKYENLEELRRCDFVKGVVRDKTDLQYLLDHITAWPTKAQIAIGPLMMGKEPSISPADITAWMRIHGLFSWRLNLQLHKYIWPEYVAEPLAVDLKKIDCVKYAKRER